MKKVIIEERNSKTILLSKVGEDTPIFAYTNGKLVGMVLREGPGWILRLGGCTGATGFHKSRESCLGTPSSGYEFFIESL